MIYGIYFSLYLPNPKLGLKLEQMLYKSAFVHIMGQTSEVFAGLSVPMADGGTVQQIFLIFNFAVPFGDASGTKQSYTIVTMLWIKFCHKNTSMVILDF